MAEESAATATLHREIGNNDASVQGPLGDQDAEGLPNAGGVVSPGVPSPTGPGSGPAALALTSAGAAKPGQALRVEERRFRKAADLRRYPSREPAPPIPLSRHDTDSCPGRRGSDPRLDWRLQVLVGKPDVPSVPAFLKNRYCRASEEYLRAQTAFLDSYGTGIVAY